MLIRVKPCDEGANWEALEYYLRRGCAREGPSADAARAGFPSGRVPVGLAALEMRLVADARTLRRRLERASQVEVSGSDVLAPLALLLSRSALAGRVGLEARSIPG